MGCVKGIHGVGLLVDREGAGSEACERETDGCKG